MQTNIITLVDDVTDAAAAALTSRVCGVVSRLPEDLQQLVILRFGPFCHDEARGHCQRPGPVDRTPHLKVHWPD